MGSISSGPKVPSYQPSPQIIYMPAPVTTYTPVTQTSVDTQGTTPDTKSADEVRNDNLLARDRSRFGTVTTSFRGLLGLAENGARKTLLGE